MYHVNKENSSLQRKAEGIQYFDQIERREEVRLKWRASFKLFTRNPFTPLSGGGEGSQPYLPLDYLLVCCSSWLG